MSTPPTPTEITRLRDALDEALAANLQAAADLQALIVKANAAAAELGQASGDNTKLRSELRATIDGVKQQLLGAVPAPSALPSCEAEEHKHSTLVIELWKQTITVQQHFNDLQLRIRNFAITVFGAVIGAIAFALKENLRFTIGGYTVTLSTAILAAGALSWLAFYFMDRWWYHMLLVGSVRQGIALERELKKHFPNAQLTETIGKHSPIRFGFAVAFLVIAAGLYCLYSFAPAAGRLLSSAVVLFLLALTPVSLIATRALKDATKRTPDFAKRQEWISSRAGRVVFIVGFIVFILPALYLWWRGNDIGVLLAGGVVATLFAAAHEFAGVWMMHSRHKVDVFYVTGLLVFAAIAIGVESIKHPAGTPSVVTETRSTTATQTMGANTTAVETSTATSTTMSPTPSQGTSNQQTATSGTTQAPPGVTATSTVPPSTVTTGTQR